MKKRLKNPTEAAKHRNELLKKQDGLDPIIKTKITSPVLDHLHADNQHCRGVLQREINSLEGKIYNNFNRYAKHLTDMSLPEFLRNLADYLDEYNNIPEEEQVLHHTALSIDVKKFKKLPSSEQCSVLESFGLIPGSNNELRAKQARKLIKDGQLKIKDIKKGA